MQASYTCILQVCVASRRGMAISTPIQKAKPMPKLDSHPTVIQYRERAEAPSERLHDDEIRQICLDCGADDVGWVSIDRQEVDDQRDDILKAAGWTETLISIVCRMNREPIRSTARSVANLEFHHTSDRVNDVARKIVAKLESRGVRAINPAMGFPMETQRFPDKIWVVSHKPVAVAAGLGQMGIHRNVIHPRFGNFILLGTILVDHVVGSETESHPIEYNPCLGCKLCVAACPVGAISPNGDFNFNACYTHNYREFMGGFTDWTEQVAASKNRNDYRKRVSDGESASMWQSLSFGANYKAAYCMSVCPAGEDVIGPYLSNKRDFTEQTLRPLQAKVEDVYVIPGSDAEQHVEKRFPHKSKRIVRGSLHPKSIDAFLQYMPLQFQPGQSKGLSATYHFSFTGEQRRKATVTIMNQELTIREGHHGRANLRVSADAATWIGFLRRERNLAWAIATLRIRLWGSPLWLIRFGKCFPS